MGMNRNMEKKFWPNNTLWHVTMTGSMTQSSGKRIFQMVCKNVSIHKALARECPEHLVKNQTTLAP
jgi:hypothetical protein